jgi:hypothetical protein
MSGRVSPRSIVIIAIIILVLFVPLYLLRFIHPAKADMSPEITPAHLRAPVPTPAPRTIIHVVAQKLGLPVPSSSPAPHAQATPCQPCRENVNDYLAAIASPFPQTRQNVYEAPQVANVPPTLTSNAQPVPIFPNNIPSNYELGR